MHTQLSTTLFFGLLCVLASGCGHEEHDHSAHAPTPVSMLDLSGKDYFQMQCAQCHGESGEGGRSPHLWRAMGNLANVLRHRASAGKLDQAAIASIVDMIDDMARRIERL